METKATTTRRRKWTSADLDSIRVTPETVACFRELYLLGRQGQKGREIYRVGDENVR